ncbi:MAG: prolyl oligopeptidase family serine peptidase [Mucilaginibacter sp.]|nr:prolyl oligopeptidase family serine peptidase [Mucilaginibacter sp.]
MKRKLTVGICFAMFSMLLITGCKKNNKGEIQLTADTDGFVSATASGSFTKAELQALAIAKGYASYAPLIQYDVDFYKIVYQTKFKGKLTEVSGLLAIPKNTPVPPPLLSAQHGTMFRDADAPSNFPGAFTGFELFASAGFMTVIPDNIGLGVSKDIPQPYYDLGSSGLTVADMIVAVKYYLKQKSISISNKLFLVGYSEGGYVTMAAEKEIETNPAHQLTLTAAAAGAGGYDITGMLAKVAKAPSYVDPSFFGLFIQGYNSTYDFNRPLTDFFQSTYASTLPQLLDGSKTSDQVNAGLTTDLSAFFNPAFYQNLLNPSAETAFKTKVAENSFPNWYPQGKTRLYHGTADQDVFFETSQSTYTKFITAGSKQLEFIPIPNGTHETSVAPMMLNALPWFISLK